MRPTAEVNIKAFVFVYDLLAGRRLGWNCVGENACQSIQKDGL